MKKKKKRSVKKNEQNEGKEEGRKTRRIGKKKLMTCQSQAGAVVPRNYLELIWLVLWDGGGGHNINELSKYIERSLFCRLELG